MPVLIEIGISAESTRYGQCLIAIYHLCFSKLGSNTNTTATTLQARWMQLLFIVFSYMRPFGVAAVVVDVLEDEDDQARDRCSMAQGGA